MPMTRFERRARALFAGVLHLYPAHYREDYGKEMTLVFLDRLRAETSTVSRLFATLAAVVSVVMDAPGRHLDVLAQDLRLAVRLLWREKGWRPWPSGRLPSELAHRPLCLPSRSPCSSMPFRTAMRNASRWSG